MSLLRIYGSPVDPAQHCQWALVTDHREPFVGIGDWYWLVLNAIGAAKSLALPNGPQAGRLT